MQQLAIEQHQNLCSLDLHLYYRKGNAVEILARMDVRDTTRIEDMAYALTGIFDIHLTLAYGEGIKSRLRLFHELATQKGDLSFLSFETTQKLFYHYLPTARHTKYLIANCLKASTSITVSHFGICFEVQLVRGSSAIQILQKLTCWKNLKFALGKWIGVRNLIEAAEDPACKGSSSVALAIVHNIRSIILVQMYDEDWQAGGGQPIQLCYRLQCCQIEENEFKRLFDDTEADFERIWLGDKPDSIEANTSENSRLHRHRKGNAKLDAKEEPNI
ncbi:hypothetical protein BC943DRAFT_316000 [Umbelopsis sp. AD052]|nr:hypothetical protein BC943DRAFT_316000 [Umbelopsis sp. AD052]